MREALRGVRLAFERMVGHIAAPPELLRTIDAADGHRTNVSHTKPTPKVQMVTGTPSRM